MARFFNTSGPCEPAKHYMLPAAERLSQARRLIDMERYFVLHAPRQTGKTTTIAALAACLNAEGRYTALLASCEEAQAVGEDINRAVDTVLRNIEKKAAMMLSEPLRPPAVETVGHIDGPSRLGIFLSRWAELSPRPIVLFLDEIDSMKGTSLISVLRQIRAGYPDRPARFPHAMALIGMRDVRDYSAGNGIEFGTASPFTTEGQGRGVQCREPGSREGGAANIKDRSFLLANFTAEEVAILFDQHTAETGQEFTAEAKVRAWELTRGQPWLVNALAQQITLTDVSDPEVTINFDHVEAAKETLIQRRDTHLDSLLARLREKRVRGVMEPLLAGEYLEGDVMDDDIQFTEDLGLVVSGEMGLEIANPIYREIVPR
ncbi:MAG: AAA family ATPase, partial [bacterium]|nr:AAA family ATPase [bacterium]